MASTSSKISEFLSGNKKYQKKAREALPILVRQAHANQPIYYSHLAEELAMPNPRNLNYVLGCVGETLQALSKALHEDIPPIQCLVVNKATGMPGEGIGWFIDKNTFAKLPRKQQRAIVDAQLHKIFGYPKWDGILQRLNLAPEPTKDYAHLIAPNASQQGGGESPEHKRFKEFIRTNPQSVGLHKSAPIGKTEYQLPSGDVLDVLFVLKHEWVAVEAKSKISDVADIYRGLYQCIKYRSVIEAYQSEKGQLPSCRTILATENAFPDELKELRNILGVEVLEKISG